MAKQSKRDELVGNMFWIGFAAAFPATIFASYLMWGLVGGLCSVAAWGFAFMVASFLTMSGDPIDWEDDTEEQS